MTKPRNCPVAVPRERIRAALQQLAASRPLAKLRHADIAKVAGLPWQTVRKLLGPREHFAEWLRSPDADNDDTRSRILAAAARAFADKGFDRASIDEVAAAAGMTKGAVYWHFKSKDDLFFALLDQRCAAMDAYLPQAVAAAAAVGDPRRAMIVLVSGLFRHIAADSEWSRLFVEFFGRTRAPAVRERLVERYHQFWTTGAQTILANNPHCPPLAAEDLAVFWTALIDGLLLASLLTTDSDAIAARLERIIEILWDGLGQRGAFASAVPPKPLEFPPESA